jgi:hypothetical protein
LAFVIDTWCFFGFLGIFKVLTPKQVAAGTGWPVPI